MEKFDIRLEIENCLNYNIKQPLKKKAVNLKCLLKPQIYTKIIFTSFFPCNQQSHFLNNKPFYCWNKKKTGNPPLTNNSGWVKNIVDHLICWNCRKPAVIIWCCRIHSQIFVCTYKHVEIHIENVEAHIRSAQQRPITPGVVLILKRASGNYSTPVYAGHCCNTGAPLPTRLLPIKARLPH